MADEAYQAIMHALQSMDEERAIVATKLFLSRGEDINRFTDDPTAARSLLHIASEGDFLNLVRFLAQAGINMEGKDRQGYSAIAI